MDTISLPEVDGVAPVRVDLLFKDLSEDEKVDVMLYLLKNTYTHEDYKDQKRQSFLWLVYERIEDYPKDSKLAPLFNAWNQILDILSEDKKKNINISIDYNSEYDICVVLIMDWNGLVGHAGPAYSEDITDDDVIRELMSIIMYKAYSVDHYGPKGHLEL